MWLPGEEYTSTYSPTRNYQIGDVVKYGGYSYFALTFNQNSIPSTNPTDWELLSIGYNLRGDYNPLTAYYVGDTVRRAGYLYLEKS